MRSVISLRSSMALARYHLLSGIRRGHGAFAITLACAVLPILILGYVPLKESTLWTWQRSALMNSSATAVTAVYLLHLGMMIQVSALITAPRRRTDERESADLTETVPITSAGRFLGDMLGALACAVVVHLCTLPFLALAVSLSPLPSSIFWWGELVIVAVTIFGAAAASWKRRTPGPRGRVKTVGSIALFFTLLFLIFASTTRWEEFRDAAWISVFQPSPANWAVASREVMNPPLLAALLLVLYTGFLAYFSLQSIRSLERRQETHQ